jgi:MFS family permease
MEYNSSPLVQQNQEIRISSNIPKYILASTLRNFWISMPIFILYIQYNGLTFLEIGVLESFIAIFIVLTEIPSGAVADLIGKKKASVIGYLGWSMGLYAMIFAHNFWGFLLAYLLMGFGISFHSGSSSALFYDTLKVLKKEVMLLKYTGKIDLLSAFAIIIASLLGGYLYTIQHWLPFFFHGSMVLIGGFIVLTMKEPLPLPVKINLQMNYHQIKESFQYIGQNKEIRFLIFFSSLMLMPILVFVNIMEQPYILYIGISVGYIGIVFALTRGVIGLFALFRHQIESRLHEKYSFFGILFVFFICFLVLSIIQTPWLVLVLIGLFFTRDFSLAILDKYNNAAIPSEKRATILSVVSFANNLIYSVGALIFGAILTFNSIYSLNSLVGVNLLFVLFYGAILIPILYIHYHKHT